MLRSLLEKRQQLDTSFHIFRLANDLHVQIHGRPDSLSLYNMACCQELESGVKIVALVASDLDHALDLSTPERRLRPFPFRSSSTGLPSLEPLVWRAARKSRRWQERASKTLTARIHPRSFRWRGGTSFASQAQLWSLGVSAVRLGGELSASSV